MATQHGRRFSAAGQDLQRVPADGQADASELDCSWNDIETFEGLERYTELRVLVMDNNRVSGGANLPSMPRLETLSVNNNEIADLEPFLDALVEKCPRLTHLSMLKNEACPNYFSGKDADDYRRYRLFVLHRLPRLRFLDSTQVSEEERREAARVGHLVRVARPDPQEYERAAAAAAAAASTEVGRGLDEVVEERRGARAAVGTSSYQYFGKHSEGNRFILDDDL